MVEVREPLLSRIGRPALIAVGLILAVALTLFIQRNDERRTAVACQAAYAAAHSAADTAMVDRERPPFSRRDVTETLTCGDLRRSGQRR